MADMRVKNPPAGGLTPTIQTPAANPDASSTKFGSKAPAKPGSQTADSLSRPVTKGPTPGMKGPETKGIKAGSTGVASGKPAKGSTKTATPGVGSGKPTTKATQTTAADKKSAVDAAVAKLQADQVQYTRDYKSKDQSKLLGDLGTLSTDLQALTGLITGEQSTQQTKTNLEKLFGARGEPSAADIAKIKDGTPADALLAAVARHQGAFLKKNITQDNSTKPPQYIVKLYKDGKPMPVKVPAGGTWVNVYQQAIKQVQGTAGQSASSTGALQSLITGEPTQSIDIQLNHVQGVAPGLLAHVQAGDSLASTHFDRPAAQGSALTNQMLGYAQQLGGSLQESTQTKEAFVNGKLVAKTTTLETLTLADGKSSLHTNGRQFVYTNATGKSVVLRPGLWNVVGADAKSGMVTVSHGTGSHGNSVLPLNVFTLMSQNFTIGPVPGTVQSGPKNSPLA